MSEYLPAESKESCSGGHPHDLLARLYREIGISAVAAALEVDQLGDGEAAQTPSTWRPLGEDLAA